MSGLARREQAVIAIVRAGRVISADEWSLLTADRLVTDLTKNSGLSPKKCKVSKNSNNVRFWTVLESSMATPWLVWLAVLIVVLLAVLCVAIFLLLARRQSDPDPALRMLAQQLATQGGIQRELAHDLTEAARANRAELGGTIRELGASLELQLQRLRVENDERLEQMRRTVDEQLQSTLEQRLDASFARVAERLEQVQHGLGQMQALAGDVGDLKRVLTNVKTRGIWGEAQLEAILAQLFDASQYASNVEVVPGSNERVEFALRLPGTDQQQQVWLPIDAKFPREDYERLLDAQEKADQTRAAQSARSLAQRIRTEGKRISDKYVSPPATTDFALLFVPVEGLFAELARQPGLTETLHREQRVILAGPTTLAAILSSLQMGMRTIAVEQRSGEIRQLLTQVKSEFATFGQVLARTRDQLEKAAGTIGTAETRTRVISRKLRDVESLPVSGAPLNLPESEPAGRPEQASLIADGAPADITPD